MTSYLELAEKSGRTYLIGDIHGCLSELTVLLEFFHQQDLNEEDTVVFIGDYIDRGPDSKGVLEALISFDSSAQRVFLKGNHEDMLLRYLAGNEEQEGLYLANGGDTFLSLYGWELGDDQTVTTEKIDQHHREFLDQLTRYAVGKEFVFAHAGVNPLRDLKVQLDEDLFWIRDEFIEQQHFFKKTVVFGHTPFWDVLFHLPYKIGIDTGLVYGNKLSCIELKEENVFQIAAGAKEVVATNFEELGGRWPDFS